MSFESGPPVAILVFAAVLAIVLLLAFAVMPAGDRGGRLRRRIERTRRAGRAEARPAGPAMPASVRREQQRGILAPLSRRLQSLMPRAETLGERIARAGLNIGVADLVVGCAGLGVATAALLQWFWHPPVVLSACTGIVAATGLPHLLLGRRIARRTTRFVTLLPDAIDLIVRGVRSGLPVAEAINALGEEMAEPVGATFRDVTGNLRLGMTMDEALWNAARKLQIQEFKFFVISLSIQQETGGNLAEILQNLSQMIRRREQVKLKIKAMSSEARASAMIIGSLPFIMTVVIYLINPGYIMQLFTDPRGWLLVAGGLTSMALGLGVIAKMVRFEI